MTAGLFLAASQQNTALRNEVERAHFEMRGRREWKTSAPQPPDTKFRAILKRIASASLSDFGEG